MSDDNKAVSTTKLVVIDTKTLKAWSYEGNIQCGEANLPNPDDDEAHFTTAGLMVQIDAFRKSANIPQIRA